MQRLWTRDLNGDEIDAAPAGLWLSITDKTEGPEGDTAAVSILKGASLGPIVLTAGGESCAAGFDRLLAPTRRLLPWGALVVVRCRHDPVAALESARLKPLVDDADEIVIGTLDGRLSWSRLCNRRIRVVEAARIHDETVSTLTALGFETAR